MRIRSQQRPAREHPVQPLRDRLGLAQVVRDAVAAQPLQQDPEALAIPGLAPGDAARIARETAGICVAISGLSDEHAVEQQLDADVRDRALGTACTAATLELL